AGVIDLPGVSEMFIALSQVLPWSCEAVAQTSGLGLPGLASSQITWIVPSGEMSTSGSVEAPGVLEMLLGLPQVLPPSAERAKWTSGEASAPEVSHQPATTEPSLPTSTAGSDETPGDDEISAGLDQVLPPSVDET